VLALGTARAREARMALGGFVRRHAVRLTPDSPASLLDGDRVLGAVLLADARLLLEVGRHVLVRDQAVAAVVDLEHVIREDVAATVPDTEVGIDAHLHDGGVNASGRESTARRPTGCFGSSRGLIE